VLTENFRPNFLDEIGFSDAQLQQRCPRLVIAHLKGFLSGPYEERTALDELVQMMSGLAYMTGSADKPTRIGSSVIDITAGMFGAIAILAALRQRDTQPGPAPVVKSALFETAVMMVAQHMAQFSITGEQPVPMQERRPAWGVYDLFPTQDQQRLFIAAVTDRQWHLLCDALSEKDLAQHPDLQTNAQRQAARGWLVDRLAQATSRFDLTHLAAELDQRGLPYAPVTKPHELLTDPHLMAGGLLTTAEPRVGRMKVPALPIEINGQRLPLRQSPPKVSEHTDSLLTSLGLDARAIDQLRLGGIIA
jgi:crotonobetainyl-CoA:carnitine CoA-transferase CaiB-like acyl-CoA transferase